jgi:hypothetical protein
MAYAVQLSQYYNGSRYTAILSITAAGVLLYIFVQTAPVIFVGKPLLIKRKISWITVAAVDLSLLFFSTRKMSCSRVRVQCGPKF